MNRMQMELKEIASGGKMLGLCIAMGISTVLSIVTALSNSNVAGGIVVNILSILVCYGLFNVYNKASKGNTIDSSSINLVRIIYKIKTIVLIVCSVILCLGCLICVGAKSTIAEEIKSHQDEIFEWIDENEDLIEESMSTSTTSKDEFIDDLKELINNPADLESVIMVFAIIILITMAIIFIIMILYYVKMTRLLKGVYVNSLGGSQVDTYASGYVSFCLIISAVFAAFGVLGSVANPLSLLSSLASVATLVLTYLLIKEYKETTFRMAYAQPQAYMPQGYGQGVNDMNQGYNQNNYNQNNFNNYNGPQYNNQNNYNNYNGPQFNNPNDNNQTDVNNENQNNNMQ